MGHMSPQKTFEEGAMAYQPVISIQRNGTFNIFNHTISSEIAVPKRRPSIVALLPCFL